MHGTRTDVEALDDDVGPRCWHHWVCGFTASTFSASSKAA